MEETRRKFDADFKEGAVRLVRETGKPIAQVARELGIKEGTLGNWVNADRRRRDGEGGQLSEDERAELVRLHGRCAARSHDHDRWLARLRDSVIETHDHPRKPESQFARRAPRWSALLLVRDDNNRAGRMMDDLAAH